MNIRDNFGEIVIIALLLIMSILLIVIIRNESSKTPSETDTLIRNNIQGAHAFDIKPYRIPSNDKDGYFCVNVEDWGEVYGSSMQPTFFEGNTVLTKRVNENTLFKTGDIVRFYRISDKLPDCAAIQRQQQNYYTQMNQTKINSSLGGSWIGNDMAVIHRINAIYEDDFVMQGDNLNEQENIKKCQITHIVGGILFT